MGATPRGAAPIFVSPDRSPGKRLDGLLIWQVDYSQEDNNTSTHPGQGLVLPIDARPTPIAWPGTCAVTRYNPQGVANCCRSSERWYAFVNLSEWGLGQGVDPVTAGRWFRVGKLRGPFAAWA